jgi:hypothetical protein
MDDGWVDSPFRTKGVLYLGTQTFFHENSPKGIEAVAEQLPAGRLREFVTQRFLAGGQYEVMVVPALIAAEARAMRTSLDRYLLQRTRWQAEKDIHGVYRILLKLTSPEAVVARLPKVITQMFNFGAPVVEVLGPKRAQVLVTGIPAALIPWLQFGFRVYCETAVELAGGKVASYASLTPVDEPPKEGFPIQSLRGTISWT